MRILHPLLLLLLSLTLPLVYCSSRSAGPETLQQGCGLLVHRCHHLHIVSRAGIGSAPEESQRLLIFSSLLPSQHLKQHPPPKHVHVHVHSHTHTHTHTHTHAHSSRRSCPDRHPVIKTEFSVNPLCSHMAFPLSASHPRLLCINVLSPTLWNEQLKREETS